MSYVVHTWYGETLSERVPGVACGTAAYRIVIDHLATCALTTRTGTRIPALAGQTGLRQRALGAHHALWATRGRGPNVSCLAGADAHAVVDTAHTVRSTRRRVAGIHWHHSCNTTLKFCQNDLSFLTIKINVIVTKVSFQ